MTSIRTTSCQVTMLPNDYTQFVCLFIKVAQNNISYGFAKRVDISYWKGISHFQPKPFLGRIAFSQWVKNHFTLKNHLCGYRPSMLAGKQVLTAGEKLEYKSTNLGMLQVHNCSENNIWIWLFGFTWYKAIYITKGRAI